MASWSYMWLLWLVAEGQVTFHRSCDCEFTVDGKCAYTLMLPLGTSGTCSGDSGATASLRQSVSLLQRNVSALRDWLSEQSRLLALAQSGVISLQLRVSSLSPGSPNDTSPSFADQFRDHNSQIVALQGAVARVHETATSVAAVVHRLEETTTELAAQLAKHAQLAETIGNTTAAVDRMAADLRQMQARTGNVCRFVQLFLIGSHATSLCGHCYRHGVHFGRHKLFDSRKTPVQILCHNSNN